MKNNNYFFIGTTALLLLLTHVHGAGAGQDLKRTNLLVDNLSCSSCLNTIAEELSSMAGYIGMAGDLRRGQIMVDHRATINEEGLATAITRAGYPARVDWTASITEDKANVFPVSGNPSSSCGGGCSSGAGGGSATWGGQNDGKTVLTTMQVDNLSCISCLTKIEEKMRTLKGTIGMKSDMGNKLVTIEHLSILNGDTVAAAITELGYPATIVTGTVIKTANSNPAARAGTSCNSRNRPCNATASAWKTLYRRYFDGRAK